MPHLLRSRPSPAIVIATLSLFVALGGVGYALTIPRASVGTKQLKRNAVTSKKVDNDTLTGRDIRERSLRRVNAASLLGNTLDQVRSGIDAAALGGIQPGGFIQGSGGALGGTATLQTAAPPPVTEQLVEFPGLPTVSAVWAPMGICGVRLDETDSVRYVIRFGAENGVLHGDADPPPPGTDAEYVAAAGSDGNGAIGVTQVTTTGASPQVFTILASARWDGPLCICSVQVFRA
jgi:hypothetical protein